ncbi:hypothetical protein [Nostoc sp. LPT]|uniref:hypothetical protein n=1 Tax=Nostoc sp. LPT TaxID=2815387 RepID=UPI001DD3EE66|nr:hypothetical protein [Nostoc sp. LPT]MBN4002259.1 hypothetical protein [Nostoc sp. LPT]
MGDRFFGGIDSNYHSRVERSQGWYAYLDQVNVLFVVRSSSIGKTKYLHLINFKHIIFSSNNRQTTPWSG